MKFLGPEAAHSVLDTIKYEALTGSRITTWEEALDTYLEELALDRED